MIPNQTSYLVARQRQQELLAEADRARLVASVRARATAPRAVRAVRPVHFVLARTRAALAALAAVTFGESRA